ncbi:hypothetical protein ACWDTG_26270, partial [Rhodococcus zopfii]
AEYAFITISDISSSGSSRPSVQDVHTQGGTPVVTHTESGRLLRELTLGPVGTYHRNGNKRGRPRKIRVEEPESVVSAVS